MFETAELGRSIGKAEFTELEQQLHIALLAAQRRLESTASPVILIVSGVEGAGKGQVVNRFHQWLDVRNLRTAVFWEDTDDERQRPRFWRFWRALPARGRIVVMFGSWYTKPIIDHALAKTDQDYLDREMHRIAEFEQLLTDDGALIVKLWFHLSKDLQKKRLKADKKEKTGRAPPQLAKFAKSYDRFLSVSERAIRVTDVGTAPWHIIEASDERYRDITAGTIVLQALERHLENGHPPARGEPARIVADAATVLDRLDLSTTLPEKQYGREMQRLQVQLGQLAWQCRHECLSVIAVFEGWDAAGKGGAIRRVTQSIDARLYQTISTGAPTDEELAHHYLWRFWRHVPGAGYMTIYDRSWYGRVLVERVEALTPEPDWRRAYQEINDFEEQLCDNGTVLLKFWMHIDPDEQLRRFEERQRVPWKHHKITAEDWRNRERWDDYKAAVNEMVERTSTETAPWILVPANDKQYARVQILKSFCSRIKRALR